MALMYSVTEFCTSLKAACFMHAFENGYDRCVYLDPDILVTSDLNQILGELETCSIVVTPHLCRPSSGEGPRSDRGILATGCYNLGFIGLRQSPEALSFLKWWHERLRRQAFSDSHDGLYTDQRWIDLVPSLFPAHAVRVWRHLGCNVAPWNYHERQIRTGPDGYTVESRSPASPQADEPTPLIFLHFSGFDFRRILEGRFDQVNLPDLEQYQDLRPLYAAYAAAIEARAINMKRYLAMPYGFDAFADGSPVLPSHRRLFRVWRERHGDAADPFASGTGSFYAALKARGLLARRGAADVRTDKATARSVDRPEMLIGRARAAFRLLFRLLGRSRFFFLVRGLNRLSHVEQHYDTFRLDEAEILTAPEQSVAKR